MAFFDRFTAEQIAMGIAISMGGLAITGAILAWVDLMWPEWKTKIANWRTNRENFDSIYLISAGRLWSVLLTTLILVEVAFVFTSFNQSPSWLVIVHHAYVVITLSWLVYAAYTIKALERSVRRK